MTATSGDASGDTAAAIHSELNETESKEVSEAERFRNLLACETTLGICNKSLLSPGEKEKVVKLERELNLVRCKTGSGICDHSLLDSAENEEVTALEHERNLLECERMVCRDSEIEAAGDLATKFSDGAASAPKYIHSLRLSEAVGRLCRVTLRCGTVWGTTVPL